MQLGQTVIHLVFTLIQQTGKGIPAIGLDELVRVLGPGDPQDPNLEPRFFQDRDGPLGGGNAGPVPVVGENGIFEVAGEQLGVLLGEGGAQRGHCVVKPRLMQGDGVHIALGEDDPARF